DGIRDFHVTGVQTCALPIWRRIDDEYAGLRLEPKRGCQRRIGHAVETHARVSERFPARPRLERDRHRDRLAAEPERMSRYVATELGRASCRARVSSSGVDGS